MHDKPQTDASTPTPLALLRDDSAVSPVIGVILMVAITVILAAVIATFVLGLGEQVSQTAPQASFTFDLNDAATDGGTDSWGNDETAPSDDDAMLNITHASGASIDAPRLGIVGSSVGDANDYAYGDLADSDYAATSQITAGDEIRVWVSPGDTIRVVWTSEQGRDSATLAEFEVP